MQFVYTMSVKSKEGIRETQSTVSKIKILCDYILLL